MRIITLISMLSGSLFWGTIGSADDGPATKRTPWTASKILGTPEPPPKFKTVNAFPHLKFDQPTVLTSAPGSDRLFLATRPGQIYSFKDDPEIPQADLFLDLTQELNPLPEGVNGVGSLYGLTFHPEYPRVPEVFICYTVRANKRQLPDFEGTRVSRFPVIQSDPPRVDASREEIVITWLEGGHNGGCLKFGPDGYLYISSGDGAPPNPPDPLKSGQDVSTLLSAILRIDVNSREETRAYTVPSDNPFVALKNARPEIWSYGYRNPWKMSFDRETGDLWVGDVGWELWEMVYRVTKGSNYGWSITEGPQPVLPDDPHGPTPILPPALALPHSQSSSVTGGFVYRGTQFPELVGLYIFGDYDTRGLWGAKFDNGQFVSMETLTPQEHRVVGFAEKNNGELLVLDYDDGSISKFVRNERQDDMVPFPTRLSETGLFADTAKQIPTAGVYPFQINTAMWMDGAKASRYIALPAESSVTWYPKKQKFPWWDAQAKFHFPEHAVLAKTITLETTEGPRHVETQILHYDGRFWLAYTYRWNDSQTDATLVPNEGDTSFFSIEDKFAPEGKSELRWTFHGRNQCLRCHNRWNEYGLAFSLPQLNLSNQTVGDQLEWLQGMRLITKAKEAGGMPVEWPADAVGQPLARFDGPVDNLDHHARSYLQVNCAHCHQMHAGGTTTMALNFELPMSKMQLVNAAPMQGDFGIPAAKLMVPGDPFRSILYYRMARTGSGHMPHIGAELVDTQGLNLIKQWISGTDPLREQRVLLKELLALNEEPRNRRRTAIIKQLLETPQGGMLLSGELQEMKDSHPELSAAIVKAVLAHEDVTLQRLFTRFLPASARQPTLGAVVKPEVLLSVKGDASAGEKLFFNEKLMQCSRCHKVGERGGVIGPALHDVGKRLKPHDIVESLLTPSKKIDPKFQTWVLLTSDGKVFSGLLLEQTDQQVTLVDVKGDKHVVATSDIEDLQKQQTSLMPDQLLRDLTATQARDLIAYLLRLKG